MYKYIGIFNHNGNQIDITDPCYDKGTWCRTTQELPRGTYDCGVEIVDCGDWGKRIAKSFIIKEDYSYEDDVFYSEYVDEIGVDAGLAGFFDNKPDYNDDEWSDFCDMLDGNAWVVDEATAAKCSGFFTSSGFGDGGYDVLALYDINDTLIGYEIEFIKEENEEDE